MISKYGVETLHIGSFLILRVLDVLNTLLKEGILLDVLKSVLVGN
jgi:hypothetical protein